MTSESRLERLSKAIAAQRAFLHRVPDPDTRERAEEHLLILTRKYDEAASGEALPDTWRMDCES